MLYLILIVKELQSFHAINTEYLKEVEKIKDLMTLCEFPVDQEWNLIYRASQDGFEASNFDSKCD